MTIAIDFQTIHTKRKSFESWQDPPMRSTFAKSDTTEITNAGPRNIFNLNIIPSIL